jgi:2-methylcitrate dehydratase PrpD
MPDFTHKLATFVIETPAAAVPDEVLQRAHTALVDTIGCALAGWSEKAPNVALDHARFLQAAGRATIWGAGFRTSPAEAAFVNGIAAHVLDFDDSLPGLRGHPSAPILAAALAAAELGVVSGREVLVAYALAVEVIRAVGSVLGHGHYFRGWHTSGTAGIFAAAAATARLLGASTTELCGAWGTTASQAAGLRKNFGTMTKAAHVGHAARDGLEAAWLAHNGFDANPAIFEGDDGFFAVYGGEDGIAPNQALARLGNPWAVLDPGLSIKRWPCCFGAHRPLGGLFQLIARDAILAGEVDAVNIDFLPMSDKALTHTDPQTGLEGKFSIEYCAAAALLDGEITLDSFTDEKLQRPEIRQLMAKVHRRHIAGEGSFNAHHGYTDIEIVTTRGRHTLRAVKTPGSRDWPLSKGEIQKKFIGCARTTLGPVRAQTIFRALDGFAAGPDAGALVRTVLDGADTAQRPLTKPSI